jgi:hypothetical protein
MCACTQARKWNLGAAVRDLIVHADWREKAIPGVRIRDEQVQGELQRGLVMFVGFDKHNRPAVLVDGSKHLTQVSAACADHAHLTNKC